MGAIAEFLGENVRTVDVSGNVFDLDGQFLLLSFAYKVFLEVEMLESFGCCCFGPVAAYAVVIVDDGGQGNVHHVQIGSAVAEGKGILDALVFPNISDSDELREVRRCRRYFQERGPVH